MGGCFVLLEYINCIGLAVDNFDPQPSFFSNIFESSAVHKVKLKWQSLAPS
jgi:hypothetical protein